MKVYPLSEGSAAVVDDGERYEGDSVTGLDVPEHLGQHLLSTHLNGAPAFEDSGARSLRLVEEHEAAERDPKTLLDAVRALQKQQDAAAAVIQPAEDEAPVPAKKAAAKKAAATPGASDAN